LSLSGTLSVTTTATSLSPIGPYPVIPSGLTSTNYVITFVNGVLDVTTGFRIVGFFQPVDMTKVPYSTPYYNSVKGGQTVPLKFRIYRLDGTEVTSVTGVYVLGVNEACEGTLVDPIVIPTETGATVLRYADGQFIYNWAVPKTANRCYHVWVKAPDESVTMVSSTAIGAPTQEAYFKSK
jgi:hypothetical protein